MAIRAPDGANKYICLPIYRSEQKQNELCVQFVLLLMSHVVSCPAKTKSRAKNILLYHFFEPVIDGANSNICRASSRQFNLLLSCAKGKNCF